MKMISRRDFLKASAVVGATGVLTALSLIHIFTECSGRKIVGSINKVTAEQNKAKREEFWANVEVEMCIRDRCILACQQFGSACFHAADLWQGAQWIQRR